MVSGYNRKQGPLVTLFMMQHSQDRRYRMRVGHAGDHSHKAGSHRPGVRLRGISPPRHRARSSHGSFIPSQALE